jgi:hypothetical protein
MKPIKISLAFCLLLLVCVKAQTQTSNTSKYPDAAMKEFSQALLKKDKTKFLSFFSKTKTFTTSNPMNVISEKNTYKQLEADLKKKEGLYYLMEDRKDNGDLDCFRDYFDNGNTWKRVGTYKFVPKDHEANSDTFILWRKEGSSWVISKISYPSA